MGIQLIFKGNNNMADAQTREVDVTLAPLI
jgi:hypothetical protein